MKIRSLSVILMLGCLCTFSYAETGAPEFRSQLFDSLAGKARVEKLSDSFRKSFGTNTNRFSSSALAYYSSLEFLKAGQENDARKKLKEIESAVKRMDDAVKKDMKNMEARFLRFYFYTQIPAVQPVRAKINEDISKLVEALSDNSKLGYFAAKERRFIVDKLLGSKLLDKNQTEKLSQGQI